MNRVAPRGGVLDLQRETLRAFEVADRRPRGVWSPRQVNERTRAAPGDLLRCDSTYGAFVVLLPPISVQVVGQSVAVKLELGANAVRVATSDGSTIDLEMSTTIDVQGDYVVFTAVSLSRWMVTQRSAATDSTFPEIEPLWEWNGTDATQFSSLVNGASVDSSSLAVVSAFGRNWLEFTVTDASRTGAYDRIQEAIAPISATLPTNYRLEAEIYNANFGTTPSLRIGLGARFLVPGATANAAGYVAKWYAANSATNSAYITKWDDNATPTEQGPASVLVDGITTAAKIKRISIEARNDVVVVNAGGIEFGWGDASSPFSAAGKAGLICGCTTNGTAKGRFSNIKVWAL